MKKTTEEYLCDGCNKKCEIFGELEEPEILVKETKYGHEHHFCSYACLVGWARTF